MMTSYFRTPFNTRFLSAALVIALAGGSLVPSGRAEGASGLASGQVSSAASQQDFASAGAGGQAQIPGKGKTESAAAAKRRKAREKKAAERRQAARKLSAERDARARSTPSAANPSNAGGAKSLGQGIEPAEGAEKGDPPQSPSMAVAIEPAEDDVAPEQRMYSFSCKDCTYSQLVEGFARQTGLGVIGKAPKAGKVNFVTTELLTFDQALARIRMLLFDYKPLEPYWMKRKETHLEVIRVNDVYRDLELKYMFRSVEEFRAAKLLNDELALVIYTPKSGSVADLRIVRDFMPDYVRVAPLKGNSVTIFALVEDIEKYLDLITVFVGDHDDPRTIKPIVLKYILPSEAVTQLDKLMGGSVSGVAPRSSGRSRGKDSNALQTIKAPGVIMMPNDTLGVLLVRAMKDKIEEIERLLPYIDVDSTGGDHDLVLIPVQHTEAASLISVVQNILTAYATSPDAASGKRKLSSRKKATRAAPRPRQTYGVTMMAHPTHNAILVIADEEGLERVRGLIARFDVPPKELRTRIPVEHVSAKTLVATLHEQLKKVGGPGKAPPSAKLKLMADPADDALWFTGTAYELNTVRDLMAIFDVPEKRVSWHVATVVHQRPSFIVNMLREYVGSASKMPTARPKVKQARVVVSRFTADDEHGKVYVLCTDKKWEQEFVPIIEALEASVDSPDYFERLSVENVSPEVLIQRLKDSVAGDLGMASIRYAAIDGGILVFGATRESLANIKLLLPELDRAIELERRSFEIQHRVAGEIREAVEKFLGAGASSKASRPRPRPGKTKGSSVPAIVLPELTIVQIEDRLIVYCTPAKMVQVAELIADLDVPDAEKEMRVYEDFPAGVDITGIADTLASEISGVSKPKGRRSDKARGAPDGPRFIPQPTVGRLIVLATPAEFPRIERLLDVLRVAVDVEAGQTEFIDVQFADLEQLIELISPLLEMKVRELVASGRLKALPPAGPGISTKTKRGAIPSKSTGYFHLAADEHNQRLVVGGAQPVVDEVKRLVLVFDRPDSDEVLFRVIALKNAEPKEMARTLKEMMGPAGGRARRKMPTKGGKAAEIFDETNLAVVESPGGNGLVLHGPARAVDQAAEWIEKLDAQAISGRGIDVYRIQYADITRLAELIMNVVDAPSRPSPKTRRPLRPAAAASVDEDDPFETTKTWVGASLYIQADLVASTMIVAAPASKLREVRGIVEQFETKEDDWLSDIPIPRFLYTLEYRTDAYEAAFDLELLLDQIWDPPSERPKVDSLPFGATLVVKYLDESRFDEIRDLIREHIDKLKPGYRELKKKGFSAPKGLSAKEMALYIMTSHPELNFRLIDNTPPDEDLVEQLKPLARGGQNPCVLPLAFGRLTGGIAMLVPAIWESQDAPEETQIQGKAQTTPPNPGSTQEGQVDPLTAAAEKLLQSADAPSQSADQASERVGDPSFEEIKIYINDNTGEITIEGPQGIIDETQGWFEDIIEEMEGLPEIPDIRIYRVRYLDVYTAAEILGEMFNATRQQRQTQQQQQRQLQQRQRQAQQQAQRQAQQQQARGGQQPQQGRGGQRGQQPQAAAPSPLPVESVRIYPNPRDRTLILRADTSQYPVLLKLLATIDQPQPINSAFKVFRLKKLNASDVEELLKNMLNLDAGGASRPRPTAQGGARRGGAASRQTSRSQGGFLPETLMEKMATGAGQLGVDPKDIKLSSNEETNTIIVMAPKVALKFVGELIAKLENEEILERVTRYYDLIHADVDSVAGYLETHFGGSSSKKGGDKKGGGSGGRLNTPSFIAYPRLNMLTALATEEQLVEIDGIIKRLDVGSESDQWEHVTLLHADAQTVADNLSTMFGGAESSAPKGRKGASSGGKGPTFIGESGGKIVLYSAPQSLHEQILQTIGRFEDAASDKSKLRVIKLTHARPSDLAKAIEGAYGSRSAGRSRGSTDVSLTVTAHDPSGRLFIQSDEGLFAEIESLAKTLDQPKKMPFEFRIFPLVYANARQVHTQLTALWTDYLRLLPPEIRKDVEMLSIDVNETANALVALGSPQAFGFLEENLLQIDVPAALAGKPGFLMVAFKNADATEVAQIITRLWAAKGKGSSELPPQAEANRGLNTLIVRGTQAQLDEIKREIIDPLEAQTSQGLLTETINLSFARADAVADSINQIFQDKKQAMQNVGKGRAGSALAFTVVVTPDVTTNQVIVHASEENLKLVKARIAELDREDVAERLLVRMEIYPVSYAKPSSVAKIINDWAKSRASGQGKGAKRSVDIISAMAEDSTQTVVVTATYANQLIVKELIDSLDDESIAERQRSRHVLKLTHAPSEDIANHLTQVFRAVSGRSKSEGTPTFVADLNTNALIASVNAEELEEVKQLLVELDARPSSDIERTTEVYRLRYASPESIANVINNMFKPSRGGAASPIEKVNAWVESSTQTVIVTAAPRKHALVRALIDKADSEDVAQRDIHVVQLNNASAEDVAATLRELMTKGGRSADARLTISAMKGSRSLLIKSGPEDFAEIQTIVAELDRDDAFLGEVVRVVPLLYSTASEMQAAIEEYLRKPGGGGRGAELAGGIRISLLTKSNSLVVSGDKDEVDRLESIIKGLDAAGGAGSGPQIIHLEHAAAGDIAPSLEAMFSERRGTTGTRPVIIASGKRLLVRADPTDLASIRSLVEKLDTEGDVLENFRIISVTSGLNVTDLADKVQRIINESARKRPGASTRRGTSGGSGAGTRGRRMAELVITPDPRTSSLLLGGSPELFNDAEKMVRALEKMGPAGGLGLRMIQLRKIPFSDIQNLIERLKGEGSSGSRGGSTTKKKAKRRG